MRKFIRITVSAGLAYVAMGVLLTVILSPDVPNILFGDIDPAWPDPSQFGNADFWIFSVAWPPDRYF